MPALPEIIWNSALAPAMAAESATAPDLTDHPDAVAELLDAHHAKHHRFRLDERAFAEAIEEPPLFLRAAGFCR